ncbi:DUF3472 domain-containing protein [Pedobacter mendelii]|uniref:DUF5077 domain-containing protein n=1 Tax=Pedobacter mendelii TaxID=1908240 RepID=A0ABQ2BE12_9SPHI|nr:DUF5077 domain-containing protein [Pedobacter mendelii]GGI22185.1 hypothetical protein GCM10008119_01380 [Pedobacter mendelii]
MKLIYSVLTLLSFGFLLFCCKKSGQTEENTFKLRPVVIETGIAIPVQGNSFITQSAADATETIGSTLSNWKNTSSVISTYFKVGQAGKLNMAIKGSVITGKSVVKLSVNGTSFEVTLSGTTAAVYPAGVVDIETTGYVKVDLQGISKEGTTFAEVSDIMIGGSATASNLQYASVSTDNQFYWSRRGPSVHLNYTAPAGDNEWMYNEITVPAGQDNIGSYYMSNGFNGGYFGIQVKSTTERWVLFSVWDADSGGKTVLTSKGADVVNGNFAGEGTGGQSYLVYKWKAGNTYKFLTQIKPDGTGNTIYSSWFFAPELGLWKFMATFKRPSTTTYVTGLNSFLENFNVDLGYTGRKALYNNMWTRSTSGIWTEITSARFTCDPTGSTQQRMDFKGGVEDGKFYLQNGAFFNDFVPNNTNFIRTATGVEPAVNLTTLPTN